MWYFSNVSFIELKYFTIRIQVNKNKFPCHSTHSKPNVRKILQNRILQNATWMHQVQEKKKINILISTYSNNEIQAKNVN